VELNIQIGEKTMDEYKAIMKLIDQKLAEDEMRIEFLRGENDGLRERCQKLEEKNLALELEVRRQDGVISELKAKIKELKGDCNNVRHHENG
jgi:chromosome segregation ATPase